MEPCVAPRSPAVETAGYLRKALPSQGYTAAKILRCALDEPGRDVQSERRRLRITTVTKKPCEGRAWRG